MATHSASAAFTLVELLVVVALIVILVALMAPALDTAIDRAVRTRCAAQQRALITVFTTYAADQRRRYPPGTRGARIADGTPLGGGVNDYDEHTPYLAYQYVAIIKEYAGNSNEANWYMSGYKYGGLPPILVDPSFPATFGLHDGAYGVWMGYNYLASHPYVEKANASRSGIPEFRSPMGLNNAGTGEMWACHNTWEVNGRLANVAHTRLGGPAGGGDCFNWSAGKRPEQLDSAGGNLGRVDGSVSWKDIEQMHEYASGADKFGNGYWGWPAMW